MKKILTIALFALAFSFSANAQESAATTAAPAKKACCASEAKTASADKASCPMSGMAMAAADEKTAPATETAQTGALQPVATAATEKKSCKTGASCCASKGEAKKVL